jgi:AmmeMemoRadiSam system protein B
VTAARPRLRRVDAFPLEHEGRRFLGLRDPGGYAEGAVMLPIELLEIVARFDGEHSVADIQMAVLRATGEAVPREGIEELVATLDAHGFLEGEAFEARRGAIDADFLAAPTRPATHVGGAYAADPGALAYAMDGFFTSPAGPGPIQRHVSDAATKGTVRGVIAPHIDFHRGGPAYAWAYRDVAERGDADVFVVFGTCHAGMQQPFALTRKAYDTPFGPAAVDVELVDAVARRARGLDLFDAEAAHRSEHSIEFQAVFLQYLYAGRRDVRIVPILTSFAHEAMACGTPPSDIEAVRRFHDALGETLAATARRVVFVAGADLAHVGPQFGDPAPLSAADLLRVEEEDRAMLESVERGDADGFFASVAGDADRRRICGLSPIYSLLRMVGTPGVLRRYAQWPDPRGTVTFASVVL